MRFRGVSDTGENLAAYSKDEPVSWAVSYFWLHESNFRKILDQHKEIFGEDFHRDHDIVGYYDEIIINIPSIYLML